jgi:hypothetical protein
MKTINRTPHGRFAVGNREAVGHGPHKPRKPNRIILIGRVCAQQETPQDRLADFKRWEKGIAGGDLVMGFSLLFSHLRPDTMEKINRDLA